MAKVYVVVDWSNNDVLGVYSRKSSAKKSLKGDGDMEGEEFDADIVEMKVSR